MKTGNPKNHSQNGGLGASKVHTSADGQKKSDRLGMGMFTSIIIMIMMMMMISVVIIIIVIIIFFYGICGRSTYILLDFGSAIIFDGFSGKNR